MIDGENCVKMIHSDSDLSISICDFFSFLVYILWSDIGNEG